MQVYVTSGRASIIYGDTQTSFHHVPILITKKNTKNPTSLQLFKHFQEFQNVQPIFLFRTKKMLVLIGNCQEMAEDHIQILYQHQVTK